MRRRRPRRGSSSARWPASLRSRCARKATPCSRSSRSTPDIVIVEGGQASQASALNAGLAAADADAIAILEDDDQWQPNFLEQALAAFEVADFVSSTQLAVLVNGEVLRIFDFPTPSGWVIK